MYVAAIVSSDALVRVMVANTREELTAIARSWALDVMLDYVETPGDAEGIIDPEKATLDEIANWWNAPEEGDDFMWGTNDFMWDTNGSAESEDPRNTIAIESSPIFTHADFARALAKLRDRVASIKGEEGEAT